MESDRAPIGDPRVFLAIERTYLAWTRTALALIGFGFVVARLGLFLREFAGAQGASPAALPLAQSSRSLWLGSGLVVLGIVVQSLAMVERAQFMRQFKAGQLVVPLRWSLAQLLGLALIGIGVGVTTYLVTLF